jgi:FkbM family methyltransferase
MRSLRELLSLEAIQHLRYVPRIVGRVRNWPAFLATYVRLSNRVTDYRMRTGHMLIKTTAPVDTSTIAVVFIKEDYGKVPANATVVDVGANIGVFALYAAASVGTRVFAYEPVDSTFAQLQANIAANGLENRITAYKMGVTGAREQRLITVGAECSPFSSIYSEGNNSDQQEIECLSLRDVFADNGIEHCDVLKLDCEGAEYEILYNAPDDVLGRVGRLCLEYHDQPGRPDFTGAALVRHLQKHGFRRTTPFDPARPWDTVVFERA